MIPLILALTLSTATIEDQCVTALEKMVTQNAPENTWQDRKAYVMWRLMVLGNDPCLVVEEIVRQNDKRS